MKGKVIIGRGLSGLSKYVNKKDSEHIAGSSEPRDFLRSTASAATRLQTSRRPYQHQHAAWPAADPATMG